MIKIPSQVNSALKILCDKGHSAYVVGGAVRDAFLNKEAKDWDITTSALPKEIIEAFGSFRVIETGIKHGTVTVIIEGMSIEITTYRVDEGYSDNRHPDSVRFTDRIEEDLMRRDFTVNAIAVSSSGEIVDPFSGKSDIEEGLIRCVGDADRRFKEDALRILRALRFSSVLGFEIEKNTAKSIHNQKDLIKNVSCERIFVEFCKLLCGQDAERILTDFSDVFFTVLPELEPMLGCAQNNPYHIYDVWVHTVKSVAAVASKIELRLAMLFHDSGKPQAKFTDENGVDHFYNHAKISREIAWRTLNGLNTSNRIRDIVSTIVEYHDFCPHKISKKTYRKYIALLGIDTVKALFEARRADAAAHAPNVYNEALEENATGLKILEEIEKEDSCFKIKDLKINGKDLEKSGIQPSPFMGEVLEKLLDEVMDDRIKNEKEALLRRASELAKGAENGNS